MAAVCFAVAAAPAQASVDYGPVSHKGLHKRGAASTGLKLKLQIGLVANSSGIKKAAKSPATRRRLPTGKYFSLSKLQSKYGAASSVRKGS